MEFKAETAYGTAHVRLSLVKQTKGGLEILGYRYPYGFFMLAASIGTAAFAAAAIFRYRPLLVSATGLFLGALAASKAYKIENIQDETA